MVEGQLIDVEDGNAMAVVLNHGCQLSAHASTTHNHHVHGLIRRHSKEDDVALRRAEYVGWHLAHLELAERPAERHTEHDRVGLALDRLVDDGVPGVAV